MKVAMLKKVLMNVLLLGLILFGLDRLVGYKLREIYFKQKSGDFYQTTYAIKHVKENILIFGSSRAMHHYVSTIFQNYTQMTTFNLGRDGRNILYSYTILSQVLTYHHPEIVILDMQPNEFLWKTGKEANDGMVYSLLPYANYPLIYNRIAKTNKTDLILSKIFWTYPFNSISIQMLANNYGILPNDKSINGFEPLKGSKLSKEELLKDNNKPTQAYTDSTLINAFKGFLQLAKENHINIYVVVSPTMHLQTQNSIADIKSITEKYGCNFFDYSTAIKDHNLFYDDTHLNVQGATLFSNNLAKQIQLSQVVKLVLVPKSKSSSSSPIPVKSTL